MNTDDIIERMQECQRTITEAQATLDLSMEERDELAFQLWTNGYTQPHVAELLDEADRRAGGSGVSMSAVAKRLQLMRRDRQEELLAEATS